MRKRQLEILTNSELNAWRECPARWGFSYAEGLRPTDASVPLTFGSLYHLGAAAGWHGAWSDLEMPESSRRDRAIAAAKEKILATARPALEAGLYDEEFNFEDLVSTALFAAEHYFKNTTDLSFIPLAIESAFRVPVPDNRGAKSHLLLEGVMDLVLYDPRSNRAIIQDHKSLGASVHTIEARLELDTQLTGYTMALHQMLRRPADFPGFWNGPKAARATAMSYGEKMRTASLGNVAFNVVRRARPSLPKLNILTKKAATTEQLRADLAAQETDGVSRGEVSVALIDTMPGMYEDALLDQAMRGLPVTEKQKDRLNQLKQRGDTYFLQAEFFRGPEALERWRKELWVEQRRMRAARENPGDRTRNPNACTAPGTRSCAYKAVCINPGDPAARASFRVATDPHEEVRQAEADDDVLAF